MLSDIIKPGGVSCSNVPGLTASIYGLDAPIGNGAGVLTTLDSVVLPENCFGAEGDFMEFEYFGEFFGDADTELNLLTAAGNLFASGVIDPGGEQWVLRGTATRYDANSQLLVAATLLSSTIQQVSITDFQHDFTLPITLSIKGVGTNANNVTLVAGFRRFHFQNR